MNMRFLFLLFGLLLPFKGFMQVRSMESLDSIARNTPDIHCKSVKSIADYFLTITQDEKELSRLVFSWVAYNIKYDDYAFNNAIYSNPHPDSVLNSRVAVCAGYSSIFKAIAESANLDVVAIDGFAKGYGFRNGMSVNGTNHSWNAVKYKDNWHLMDVTWGSGFAENINGKAVSKSKFCDYFFDVNPSEFIFNHYPDSNKYQFLNKKITREQFKNLTYVDARCVFPLGFNADSIFVKSKLNVNYSLPDVFCSDNINFRIVQAPYIKKLKSDGNYYFEIENFGNSRVVLLNNQQLIEFDSKNDNIKSKTLEHLNKGYLYIGIATDNSAEIIVSYTVL